MTSLLRLGDIRCHGYNNNQLVKIGEKAVVMVKRNHQCLVDTGNEQRPLVLKSHTDRDVLDVVRWD